MPDLSESSIEKTKFISHVPEEKYIMPCTKDDKIGKTPRKHKLSIDLNRPHSKENP